MRQLVNGLVLIIAVVQAMHSRLFRLEIKSVGIENDQINLYLFPEIQVQLIL